MSLRSDTVMIWPDPASVTSLWTVTGPVLFDVLVEMLVVLVEMFDVLVEMLEVLVEMLEVLVEMLAALVEMLEVLVEMLDVLVEMLAALVEMLAVLAEMFAALAEISIHFCARRISSDLISMALLEMSWRACIMACWFREMSMHFRQVVLLTKKPRL